jgi:hypothetical protein
MTEQPAGPILDGLGVTLDLAEGDLVASAIVLAKVVNTEGDVALVIGSSEGISWLEQLGLVTAGADLISPDRWARTEDDE